MASRSFGLTKNLLTVEIDKIARSFDRSEATTAVALDISKAFKRLCHAGVFHKLKSYYLTDNFGVNLLFLSNRKLSGYGWEIFAIISS